MRTRTLLVIKRTYRERRRGSGNGRIIDFMFESGRDIIDNEIRDKRFHNKSNRNAMINSTNDRDKKLDTCHAGYRDDLARNSWNRTGKSCCWWNWNTMWCFLNGYELYKKLSVVAKNKRVGCVIRKWFKKLSCFFKYIIWVL